MRIILASKSKQRRDIFDMIGFKYEVMTSSVEEYSTKKRPSKYVEELSLNKAVDVSKKVNDKAIIISADTIIYCDGKRYEKPKSIEEAYNNMMELSGKVSTCYTGITIIDLYKNKTECFSSSVKIHFRKIDSDEARWYAEGEEKVLTCCGYVPLGKASLFINKVVGDYNTLFGISPNILFDKLKEMGYKISDFEWRDKHDN